MKTTEERLDDLEIEVKELKKKRINEIATGLPELTTGTINTGDTTTDNILNSLINRVEKLITNASGQ